MKILALDTSSEHCSAALWLDGRVSQRLEHAGQRHSQLLLPMVTELLAEAGLAATALDGVAVAVGPGSFTGLRIATAVGQGIAFGADLPVASVGSLDALAWGLDGAARVACVDARMGEIYAAAYRWTGTDLDCVVDPLVASAERLPMLPDGAWTGGGNAFERCADGIAARWGSAIARSDAAAVAEARHVAAIAAAREPRGFRLPPEALIPVYVRDKVALRVDER